MKTEQSDFPKTPKVFISYNYKDQEVALKIKNKLEIAGIQAIIDIEAMKTGENISEFIKKCIKESGITLSLISANGLMSAWVAMETIWSSYDEKLRDRYFMPCNIDDSFFKIPFTDHALDVIDEKILEVSDTIAKRLKKGRGIEDLTAEHTRLKRLSLELPSIISRLKNSLCVSLIDDHFDSGMEKVIKDILSRNSNSTNSIPPETPKMASNPNSIVITGNNNTILQGINNSTVELSANLEKRKMGNAPSVLQIVQLLENNQIPEALELADQIGFTGSNKFQYNRKKEAYLAGLKGQELLDWIRQMKILLSQY